MLPVPAVVNVALLTEMPVKAQLAVPAAFAERVIPPLTVTMLDPDVSEISLAAVSETAPVPEVAMSAFAVARLMPVVVLVEVALKLLSAAIVTA